VPSIGTCGLGSDNITAAAEERDKGEGEREITEKWGRKMMGMFYMVF
jgi:hypothetical protein